MVFSVEVADSSDVTLATLGLWIPIHLYINRYSHQNLNDWNGNSLEIDT